MVARRRITPVLVAIVLTALAGCRGPVQPHESLAPQVANLRAQFNKDVGTVRMVVLAAPS